MEKKIFNSISLQTHTLPMDFLPFILTNANYNQYDNLQWLRKFMTSLNLCYLILVALLSLVSYLRSDGIRIGICV
jgi:hypothetical protein